MLGKVETLVYLSHFHGISFSVFKCYVFHEAEMNGALLSQDVDSSTHQLYYSGKTSFTNFSLCLHKWNNYAHLLYKVIVNV